MPDHGHCSAISRIIPIVPQKKIMVRWDQILLRVIVNPPFCSSNGRLWLIGRDPNLGELATLSGSCTTKAKA
jgi:hypothetical protein